MSVSNAGRRILALLLDMYWHAWHELEAVAGNRFSARLHELRMEGYSINSRPSRLGKTYQLQRPTPVQRRRRMVKIYMPVTAVEALLTGEVTTVARQSLIRGLASYRRNLNQPFDPADFE